MIPYTTCQKCREVLDAANCDANGIKHPQVHCGSWMRLPKGVKIASADRKAKDLDYHEIGESGA